MTARPNLLQFSLTLMLVALAVTAIVWAGSKQHRRSVDEWRDLIRSNVERQVPTQVASCGYVWLHANETAALQCVRKAEASSKSYWVAAQLQGEDSLPVIVVIREAGRSSMVELEFEEWVPGSLKIAVQRQECVEVNPEALLVKKVPFGVCNSGSDA